MTYSKAQIALAIDHAILKPEMTEDDLRAGCEVAGLFEVASVCVRPADISQALEFLDGSKVEVGTVIGFPHGAQHPDVKLLESRIALDQGATELDIVINIGQARKNNWEYLEWELSPIVNLAKENRAFTKIIFENCYLTDDQKRALCDLTVKIGADYVKTSTGFGTGGATLEDIELMRQAVKGKAKLKAAGGISDLETAIAFLDAGCQRIGCSATATILNAVQ